jgi:hypothetical protein
LGKHQYRLAEEWRRSVDAFRAGDPALDAARADARARLTVLMSGDDVHWHGWYRRHGGEVELLGDHFGDGDAMSAILVLVFAGLMWQMICATPSRPPVVAQLTPTRARKTRRK